MIDTIIASELGIDDMELVENIKVHPLCKVESVFHVRLEDGTVRFFDKLPGSRAVCRVALMVNDNFLSPLA